MAKKSLDGSGGTRAATAKIDSLGMGGKATKTQPSPPSRTSCNSMEAGNPMGATTQPVKGSTGKKKKSSY